MNTEIATQISFLVRDVVQVVCQKELQKKIEKGVPLKVKLGMDPTSPNLHLGHAIVLEKLKEFQDFGHEVIFLIGDFTAAIGDPTGKSKTRPTLSFQEIEKNVATYFDQVGRVLDTKKVKIVFNKEWLGALSCQQLVGLAAKVTLSRIIEREDFQARIEKNETITFHELLYPLFQAYDSVALNADVELGGTDQTVNLLLGRYLQEQYGQEPQVVMTMPILEGLDGTLKMSKSLSNAISFNDSASDAYGKLMSISDALMWRYIILLLKKSSQEVQVLQQAVQDQIAHPMTIKKDMAYKIVARYWSEKEAKQAQEQFQALFGKKDYSHANSISIKEYQLEQELSVLDLVKKVAGISSNSEIRRLIAQGAIKIDGAKVASANQIVICKKEMTLKVGKHQFYKFV